MARDITLLTERNKRIRADYNRLKCEEVLVKNRGEAVAIRLTYTQILTTLSFSHCLSIRTLESIVNATAPVPVPLTTTTTTTVTTTQLASV